MNGLLILLLSALVLAAGYWLYSWCVERSWGIDRSAAPPAVRLRDHRDFISTRSLMLLVNELVSICAVLVVYGPVQAAKYGWVPALAWILLGGVLIGGVQEYGVLYVSVKSRGLTLGGLFGKFAGLRWKKVFLVFAWLVCVAAIAVFADIAARALDGWAGAEEADPVRGRAGTILLLLYAFALLTGLAKRYSKIPAWGTRVISITILICATMLGLLFPASLQPSLWHIIILGFALVSAAGPVWLSLHPRAQLHAYIYILMLLLLLAGLVLGHRDMALPAYTGFTVDGKTIFPWLFVTLTCGAVSGLQAMSASCVISRQISSEGRMRRVAFGGSMLVSFAAVVALVCFGTQADASALAGTQDPGALFCAAMGGVLARFGISADLSASIYSLLIACLCIGALEAVARAARVCWQEFFDYGDIEPSFVQYVSANAWFGAGVTLLAALVLCRVGYDALLPLFGSAIQALSALALLICAVWLRRNGKNGVWVWLPLLLMLSAALTAPVLTVINGVNSIAGGGSLLIEIIRIVLALASFVVLVLLSIQGIRAFFRREDAPQE